MPSKKLDRTLIRIVGCPAFASVGMRISDRWITGEADDCGIAMFNTVIEKHEEILVRVRQFGMIPFSTLSDVYPGKSVYTIHCIWKRDHIINNNVVIIRC